MVIDIDKIIIKERIRKDFGDIQELADDIKENGLISPPVVNKNFELIAGERRLRACKLLGWPQIEVRMMDTRDDEHELNIEISENDVRKGFSKTERVAYMKRLQAIEEAKAKERQGERTSASNSANVIRSDEETAKQFGISATTMRKEIAIADNRNLLDPSDFADWDEGKLSTNKAFQKMKAKIAKMEAENKELRSREPEIKEVVREVVPQGILDKNRKLEEDNESLKRSLELTTKERKEYQQRANDSERKLKEIEGRSAEEERRIKLNKDVDFFIAATHEYIRSVGGYVWRAEDLSDVPKRKVQEYRSILEELENMAQIMIKNTGGYE